MNDAFSEAVEFEHMPPIEMIEKIIIYKPPLPPKYGGYSAVIEVITKKGGEKKNEISGALGSYESTFFSFFPQGGNKRIRYFLGFDFLRTANLTGERRTPPKEDEIYGDRSYWKIMPTMKLMYATARTFTSFYAQYVESKKFFSDEVFRGEKENRVRRLRNFNIIHSWNPNRSMRVSFNVFRTEENYRLNLKMHPSVRDQERTKQGIRITNHFEPIYWLRLSLGGEFTHLRTEEKLGVPLTLTNVFFYGAFFEGSFNIKMINLTMGLRWDDHTEEKAYFSPYSLVELRPFSHTLIYGIWNRAVRWPALSEFSRRNPNLTLQAERMQSLEIGIHQKLFRFSTLKLSFYSIDLMKESFLFMDFTTRPPVAYYQNAGDTIRSMGVEAEISFSMGNFYSFANYAFQQVRRLPSRTLINFGGPEHIVNLGFAYSIRGWSFMSALKYRGRARGVQRMMGEFTELSPWTTLDVAVAGNISQNFQMVLRISNLLNEQYETFDGRPMFGRVVVVGIRGVL